MRNNFSRLPLKPFSYLCCMKKHFYFFLLAGLGLFACKSSSIGLDSEREHDIKVYHRAIDFGDIGTAIYSIHSLLARDTANHSYYDSLALLYYNSSNFPQAVQAAQIALRSQPNNTKLMQVVADGAKKMGKGEVALPYLLKLSETTHNPEFNYEAAIIQFYGKKYDEAEKAAITTLNDPASDKYFVVIAMGNGKEQKVPLKAALHNLLGFIRQKQGKKDEAKDNYLKAIAIYPEFVLAKNNLDSVNTAKK